LFQNPKVFKTELIAQFEKYLFRQFFEIIDQPDYIVAEFITSLINKIIKEDIVSYFQVEYPELLQKLFNIFSQSPGLLLDYKSLANDL